MTRIFQALIFLLLLFVIVNLPIGEAGSPKSFKQYLQETTKAGYTVRDILEGPRTKTIILEKQYETKEGHGLLDVKWKARERWEIQFFKSTDDGALHLMSTKGVLATKAPVLGQWREVESRTELPSDIFVPILKKDGTK